MFEGEPIETIHLYIVREEEDQVVEQHGQPEMHFPPEGIHEAAEHLGVPEGDRPEEAEQAAAEEHVMEMGHDEIRVVDVDVHRRIRHEDAGEPADGEHGDEAHRV